MRNIDYVDYETFVPVDIHSLKVDEILYSRLSPEQAIKVVQDFHVEHGLIGVVDCNVDSLRFDESYYYEFEEKSYKGCSLWCVNVVVELDFSPFIYSYVLYVDDEKGEVVFYKDKIGHMGYLDSNGNESSITVVNIPRSFRPVNIFSPVGLCRLPKF